MKNDCELFKLNPNELLEAKLYTLQKIRVKEAEIIHSKQLISVKEQALLLETDFKALGYTNEKQRTAYINKELRMDKNQLDWLELDLRKFYDDLNLISDLLQYKKE